MIRWLLARPGPGFEGRRFLSPSEADQGQRYRHPGRHRQWLLGRAAAKILLERCRDDGPLAVVPPGPVCIRRAQDGWPQPLAADGRPLPLSLSISHCGDRALCAVCSLEEGAVGADLEAVAERPRHFYEDFYTERELRLLSGFHPKVEHRVGTVLWCIKEAVLKARRTGFHQSTKSVEVLALDPADSRAWKRAAARTSSGPAPKVYWRLANDQTLALAIALLPRKNSAV